MATGKTKETKEVKATKDVKAPKLKYKLKPLDATYTVMGKVGTIVLNEKASQKELEYVYNHIVDGMKYVMKVPA